MTVDDLFKKIQKVIEDVPLVLAGTGASMPYGIPGMWELANYLKNTMREKYSANAAWGVIDSRLDSGMDLESALTQVSPEPSEELVLDITMKTWEFISAADLHCFQSLLSSGELTALAKLFHVLAQSSRKTINIITTNYDRLIEYACDQAKLSVDDRFRGHYIKWQTSDPIKHSNVVNLLKVHGSLDYFKDNQGELVSIPMSQSVPNGFVPDIIPPGSNKYRSVLCGIHRDLLFHADELIKSASGYLCIGYGFNDEQIQATMLEQIKFGKPVIIITKEISETTASLLRNNSENYISITEDKTDSSKTEIVVNGEYVIMDEIFWTVDGFLKIII